MKVLLVDDDLDYGNLVAAFLNQAGHESIVLEHSLEALDVYLEERPDWVLIDIIMPFEDGIEVAQEIIDLDSSARISFMTALGDYPDCVPDDLRSRVGMLSKPLALDDSLFAHFCQSGAAPESCN